MVYVTICEECLAGDCKNCSESLIPENDHLQQWNEDHPRDMVCGGGHCICGHGEPESKFQKSVRANMEDNSDNPI